MKRSDANKVLQILTESGRKDLAKALAEEVIGFLKGPKEAQDIYLKIRDKESDKERAAKIAWDVYKKKHPDWVPKYKRKNKTTASVNFFKLVKDFKANFQAESPYGMIKPTHLLQVKNLKIYLPDNYDSFISFINAKQPKTLTDLQRWSSQFARSRIMAVLEESLDGIPLSETVPNKQLDLESIRKLVIEMGFKQIAKELNEKNVGKVAKILLNSAFNNITRIDPTTNRKSINPKAKQFYDKLKLMFQQQGLIH